MGRGVLGLQRGRWLWARRPQQLACARGLSSLRAAGRRHLVVPPPIGRREVAALLSPPLLPSLLKPFSLWPLRPPTMWSPLMRARALAAAPVAGAGVLL